MLKQQLFSQFAAAIQHSSAALNGLQADSDTLAMLKLERPRQKEHGDYAVNVSSFAKLTKMPPPKIAEVLAEALRVQVPPEDMTVSVVGGFINVTFTSRLLLKPTACLLQTDTPGRNGTMSGQRILLEYVSANPTGPLHIGHGRWAALGDSLMRIWRHCDALPSAEFYINDAGVQMRNISVALFRRSLDLLTAESAVAPSFQEAFSAQDVPYPGEYVIDLAKTYLGDAARKEFLLGAIQALPTDALSHEQLPDSLLEPLKQFAKVTLLDEQKILLSQLGVVFDRFYSEKDELYANRLPEKALEKLRQSGKVYDADDAVWFRTTDYGDEKDRVLQKSDGSYTYLTPDIAYHDDKFSRKAADGQPAFNRIVNIWGADHHGYIPRMRAAIQAMGYPVEQFEVLLGQLVNLIIDGEKTRMGKRRKMLTLADVVDEVGVDATRLWMVWKPADTALDFDVALATSTSNDNPVFYIQYAHARCCSIIRNATEPQTDTQTGETHPPKISPEAFAAFAQSLSYEQLLPMFNGIEDGSPAYFALKSVLLKLDGFDDIVADAGRICSPHLIARYAVDLASEFHTLYQLCRFLTDDADITQSRLCLIKALQKTFAQALLLLGVRAPDRM